MTIAEKIDVWTRTDGAPMAVRAVLYPLSLVYGGVVRLRAAMYTARLLKRRALPCPVISIGNITTGGTGKTPVAVCLAGLLRERGARPVILSRGYRGTAPGPAIVSDGEAVLLTAREAGDEPYLMARRLAGVPVVVSADRFAGGMLAIKRFDPGVIILDDGFQHIRLMRDIDLLCVDGRTGFGNSRLLPLGPLREPVSGATRADAVLLKSSGGDSDAQGANAVKRLNKRVIRFSYEPVSLVSTSGETRGLEALKGARVAAVAGVADPASFFSTLEALGAVVEERIVYPDHHSFTAEDLRRITRASDGNRMVVTTEKDAVRMEGMPGAPVIWALRIDVHTDTDALMKLVSQVLKPSAGKKGRKGRGA